MASPKSILIISSIPKAGKEAMLHEYLSQAMPLAMAAGGVPVGRYMAREQLIGEGGPTLIAAVEFTNAQAIRDMVASTAFQALSELRDAVFERLDMIICAEM